MREKLVILIAAVVFVAGIATSAIAMSGAGADARPSTPAVQGSIGGGCC
ncbi:hypothetical protein ABZ915_46110 [Streptomyces sp. NPDC046915]